MYHLEQIRMSYCEHFKLSMYFAYRMAVGSAKAILHAVVPDCYVTSTSDTVEELRLILLAHR